MFTLWAGCSLSRIVQIHFSSSYILWQDITLLGRIVVKNEFQVISRRQMIEKCPNRARQAGRALKIANLASENGFKSLPPSCPGWKRRFYSISLNPGVKFNIWIKMLETFHTLATWKLHDSIVVWEDGLSRKTLLYFTCHEIMHVMWFPDSPTF